MKRSSASRKKLILEVFSVVIVCVFLASSFVPSTDHSNRHTLIMNSSAKITPSVNSNNPSEAGYVKYTLDLNSNTLLSGNIVNTGSGLNPIGAAFDSANGNIYVTNDASGNVSVINPITNKVVSTVSVGSSPYGAAFDSLNGYIYVANNVSNSVSVINGATNSVISTVSVGSSPYGVAFDSSNGNIYVTNGGSSTVSVINGSTNTVKSTISVGPSPYGVAFDSANGYIYVTNTGSSSVSVINGSTNSVISTVSVGSSPYGATFDSSNGNIYVTNGGSNSVSVINGATNTVVSTITIGSFPYGAAFNSANGYIYVTNYFSGSVSIISTGKEISDYSIPFKETGLSAGTSWSVTLNGSTESSTSGTITFTQHNGTFQYSIGSISRYTISKSPGSVTVNGSNAPVNITFSLISNPPAKTSSSSGISSTELYIITGAAIALAAIGSAIFIIRKRK